MLLVTAIVFGVHFAHADTPAYPDTFTQSGYGPGESPIMQPRSAPWTVTLKYVPLNQSASVSFVDASGRFLDYSQTPDPTSDPGTLTYRGQGTDPMRIEWYAGNYTVSISY